DPEHPLSPFSDRTQPIRENDMRFFQQALEGTKVPKDLAPHLPRLLWLYQMGIILFWIYDRSPEQQKTRSLFDKSLGLVVRLIRPPGPPRRRRRRRSAVAWVEPQVG